MPQVSERNFHLRNFLLLEFLTETFTETVSVPRFQRSESDHSETGGPRRGGGREEQRKERRQERGEEKGYADTTELGGESG